MQLTFRETGLSPAVKKRIRFLILVFLVGLVIFEFALNYHETAEETTAAAPTLPLVTTTALGEELNELHAYTSEMDALYMRDAVVPLGEDRTLPLTIYTYGAKLKNASYEIRSTDTERKIAETEISLSTEENGKVTAELNIENLVNTGEEYLFILTLSANKTPVHYYTRILVPSDAHAKECLAFAKELHQNALDRKVDDVAPYLETEPEEDADTLETVTIHSTAKQVCWGNFEGEILGAPMIEINDVSDEYTALTMYYQMQVASKKKTTYFSVEEYCKVRYGAESMYLLDYKRTMTEYLTKDSLSVAENILNVGVTNPTMNYLSNETGTIAAFTQNGELFLYDQNQTKLLKLFSFLTADVTDRRSYYNAHDIRLLNIDETGTMDFVVYGYMNDGTHEGSSGIDLFRYDSNTGQVQEQLFIRSTKSYQILRESIDDLLYKSTGDRFYMMQGGTLYGIDLMTLETTELLTGLLSDRYSVSQTGRFIAYTDEAVSDKIHILDLEDESESLINAGKKTYVRVQAFLDENIVYGTVKKGDITTDAAGTTLYPMNRVFIADTASADKTVLKEYEKAGHLITDVSLSDNAAATLYLTLAVRQGDGSLAAAGEDTIKDSSGETNKTVAIGTEVDATLGKVVTMTMAERSDDDAKIALSSETIGTVLSDASLTLSPTAADTDTKYYVYVGKTVSYAGTNVTQAISLADEEMGVVLDNTQTYIWRRGRAAYVNPFTGISVGDADAEESSSARAISAMLSLKGESLDVHTLLSQGETPLEILSGALKDVKVLDLTGCSVTEVLYYVAAGTPVYAVGANGEAVLIVGYDSAGIYVFNPLTGETNRVGILTAVADFEAAGDVFIGWVE